MPTVGQSLDIYGGYMLRYLIPASVIFSVIPILEWAFTGNRGIAFFIPIAPLILLTASGLVCVVWWILLLLLKITGKLNNFVSSRSALLNILEHPKLNNIIGELSTSACQGVPCFPCHSSAW